MLSLAVKSIGTIRSQHLTPETTPIQPLYCPDAEGCVEVFPEYSEGLADLEGFSHIILIYWFDKVYSSELIVKPFLEDRKHGIFATRYPRRPNPIGLSIVQLLKIEKNVLFIGGVDILDNTPLLDIKPYSSKFDCFPDARNGWMMHIDKATEEQRGRRGYQPLTDRRQS